jgi:hypothetical protein
LREKSARLRPLRRDKSDEEFNEEDKEDKEEEFSKARISGLLSDLRSFSFSRVSLSLSLFVSVASKI